MLGHFSNQLEFDGPDRFFGFDELIQDFLEHLLAFCGKNAKTAGETVTGAILRGVRFSGLRNRAMGFFPLRRLARTFNR